MHINKSILYISARSDIGGGPKHLYDLTSHIKNNDIYIAAPLEEPYGKKFLKNSKEFFKLPHRKFRLSAFFRLLLFCKKNNINIIHSHGRGAGIYSRLLGPFGFDIIHTFHGVHHPKSVKEKFILVIERIFSLFTDKFICVSKSERNIALALKLSPKRKVTIIPNGIDTELFNNVTSPGTNQLGTIARLTPHKNVKELIEFVAKMPEYTLHIAGSGEEEEELKSLATKNVIFHGEIDNIYKFMSGIDFYVSSSIGEGLPYTILEAMASRKKIVASNVAGHKDLLHSDDLYQIGSLDSFKTKLSKNIVAYNMKNFTIKTMVDSVGTLYLNSKD